MQFSATTLFKLLVISAFFFSCQKKNSFEVQNFEPITNFGGSDSVKKIQLDYTDAFKNGFVIPSVTQVKEGKFVFSFELLNNQSEVTEYFYKLYYQNETYKIPENENGSEKNFYGSWEETGITFKSTGPIEQDGSYHKITDSIRIVGNPRNEKKFYGNGEDVPFTEEDLKGTIQYIYSTPEWLKSIKEKAVKNKISLEAQVEKDAIYTIREQRKNTIENHRWKRNPRVGNYNFMLVVTTRQYLDKIPPAIQDISKTDSAGKFVNPFSFFRQADVINNKEIVVTTKQAFKAAATVPLDKGIFANPRSFDTRRYSTEYFNRLCNSSGNLMQQAGVEQFVHFIDTTRTFNNIDKIADVNGDELSKNYYQSVKILNPVKVPIGTTDCPCKTIYYDSAQKKIVFFNPASDSKKFRKENVGITTRHGFTYGKYRVKVKMTELLNRQQIWNGITNAIWLLSMKGDWNQRSVCTKEGYIPKSSPAGPQSNRVSSTYYSEIDIEIVKGVRGWPKTSYSGSNAESKLTKPSEPASDTDKIMVTATNWDLACRDAQKYYIGAFPVKHEDQTYVMHRWDDWYQAVTTKYPAADDELFGKDYYWFEIEWKPKEIIWRMGPEKDKMKEFAWMSNEFTNIPDNQMLLIITQEYHLSDWWPEAPFDQNKIPFPSKNIYGELMAIEIE